jgi:carbamoyl-phosphate synthase large subunit
MRAGETDSAVTVESGALGALGRAIGAGLKHPGSLEGDAIAADKKLDKGSAKEMWLLGLTPHLGDGYAFSHAAGRFAPAALIAWAKGEVPGAAWLRSRADVVIAKYSGVMRVADGS